MCLAAMFFSHSKVMIFFAPSAGSTISSVRSPEQTTVISSSLSSSVRTKSGLWTAAAAAWLPGLRLAWTLASPFGICCVASGCCNASPRVLGHLTQIFQELLEPGSSIQGNMHAAVPGSTECRV